VSRLHVLAARPRRTLAALAVVLAAVGITVGSGANFQASSANPSNTFSTGTLSIANTQSGFIFNAANLKPGDTKTQTVGITNSGSLAGAFTVKSGNVTDAANLLGQINMTIEDCGTSATCAGTVTSKYSGTAAGLTTAVNLGNFAASDQHYYRFTATLPTSVTDTFQGKTATADITWSAVQS
jgi:spore coat-associated protein N